ncbi:MAG: NUDIX hydrolase, partial [Halobacteriaceae archaeon]
PQIMSQLDALLDNPTVEIIESSAEFSSSQAESVRDGNNRAAAAIIRDEKGRILLMRRSDRGWRLPGTDVGSVTEFEKRLRDALHDRVGIQATTVTPTRIHKHRAENYDDVPPYHYVLFDVEPEESPSMIDDSPNDSIELRWFSDQPDNVLNEGVMSHIFRNKTTNP